MKGIKINFFTIWILVLLLLITYTVNNNGQAIQIQTSQIQTSVITETIDIDGNDNFDSYAADESLLGNGTIGNPYIINAEIDGSGSKAISIQNTDRHFEIKDSEVYNGTDGIYFRNLTNGAVINTVIRNNTQSGITIELSNFTRFENNNVYGNGAGACNDHFILNQIKLNIHAGGAYHYDPSHNSTIVGNYIHDNYVAGIIMESATNITITENRVTSNGLGCSGTGINADHGIVAYDVENVKIEMNNITMNEDYGVYLGNLSESTSVIQNNFLLNGQTQQAYDNGISNVFDCNWWGMNTSTHLIDGMAANTDTCGQNTPITISAIIVPVSTVSSSTTSESTSSTSTTESTTSTSPTSSVTDDGGDSDDGFLFHPLGLISLVIITIVYRNLRLGLKQNNDHR